VAVKAASLVDWNQIVVSTRNTDCGMTPLMRCDGGIGRRPYPENPLSTLASLDEGRNEAIVRT
jgi:hypothetical protein